MKKMQEFEKSSMLLFALMMVGNVCNYLFQIITGHMLSVDEYGIVNTVVGIVGVLSIPTTIVTMISARYIALNMAVRQKDELSSTLKFLYQFAFIVCGILAMLSVLCTRGMTRLFGLDSYIYIYGAWVIGIANVLYSVTSGTLQGMKKFLPYGIQTILVAVGKLAFSVILILIGWKVYGVIVAILLGALLALLYGVANTKQEVRDAFKYRGNCGVDVRDFFQYTIGTIVAQSCIIALTNGDILLVKAYFSDEITGVYSSAMVLGKIAMYVSSAVVAALFPIVVEKYQKGENTAPMLKKAMLYGGGVAVLCSVGMIVLGDFVIHVLFGERYASAIEFLPYVCMFIVPLTFLTIVMNYVLAIDKPKFFAVSMLGGLILIIGGSAIFHDTIGQMMMMSGNVLLCVFVINMIYLYVTKKKQTR